MDCPLCLWALPPPHCHGALVFDGESDVCDRRGRGCRQIHPLGRPSSPPDADGGAALVDLRDEGRNLRLIAAAQPEAVSG